MASAEALTAVPLPLVDEQAAFLVAGEEIAGIDGRDAGIDVEHAVGIALLGLQLGQGVQGRSVLGVRGQQGVDDLAGLGPVALGHELWIRASLAETRPVFHGQHLLQMLPRAGEITGDGGRKGQLLHGRRIIGVLLEIGCQQGHGHGGLVLEIGDPGQLEIDAPVMGVLQLDLLELPLGLFQLARFQIGKTQIESRRDEIGVFFQGVLVMDNGPVVIPLLEKGLALGIERFLGMPFASVAFERTRLFSSIKQLVQAKC
jgi:hypothetical protein